MRRKLNARFLGCLLLAALFFGISVHFLHSYQVKRNANSLLYQANRAEEEGNLHEAADYLDRYLAYAPSDTEALAKYALIMAGDQLATTARARFRALETLEQVLRREPHRLEVRRKLALLQMDLGRYSDARPHLETLLQSSPEDSELEYRLGQCEEIDRQYDRAARWYQQAITHGHDRPERHVIRSYVRRAQLLRQRLDRAAEADQLLQGLLKLAPDEPEVILAAVEQYESNGQREEARKELQRGIELHPQDARMYHVLARLEIASGHRAEAAGCLKRGLQTVPRGSLDVLLTTADLLLDAGEVKEAREVIASLEKEDGLEAPLNYLRARLAQGDGQWREASRKLEQARPQLKRSPELMKKADLFLAQCYQQLGNPDMQQAACRRALSIDPLWVPGRLALASALAATGRLDEALEDYRKVVAQVPAAQVDVARLLLLRNFRLPPAQRNWTEVETSLDEAGKAAPQSLEVPLLRAQLLAAQDKLPEARRVLEAARDGKPGQVEFWVALSMLAERQGQPEEALRVLDQAAQQLADPVEVRLARANYLIRHRPAEASKLLPPLEEGKYPERERARLRLGLADAYLRAGAVDEARRLLQQLRKDENDLPSRLRLLDLAVQAGSAEEIGKLVPEIRRLEGDAGTRWRFGEAARLVILARQGEREERLLEARKLLDEVARQRTSWAPVSLLSAEIHELQGRPERALESYQEAIKLGERRPVVVRRAAQLLYERRRFAEADELVRKLAEQGPVSADLGRIAADLAMRNHDPKRALELAKTTAANSTDPRDHIWLGQLLRTAGQPAEAEQALRKAVALAEQSPEAWVALVVFLATTDQKEKAQTAVQQAQKKLPPAELPLALAQCYESLGRQADAEKQYQAALAARPADPAVLRGAVQFYLRTGQAGKAVAPLRTVVGPGFQGPREVVAWARRSLALALVAGGAQHGDEALALLEQNLSNQGGAVEDMRTKAVVLASLPSRRADAITLLEKLAERQALSGHEQFLLVQMYEANRDWTKARERMLTLLSAQEDQPQYVIHYLRGLLRRGEVEQARPWLAKLEKLAPDAPGTIELKARVLQAENHGADAAALLKVHAGKPDANPGAVAALLDELGQPAAAEEIYRKEAAQAKRPESSLDLALHLGRQKRVPEALDLCEQAWQRCPAEAVAFTTVAVLRDGQGDEKQMRRAEGRLQAALKTQSGAVGLLLALADLRDFQGRYADAAALHRQVLQQDSRNVAALNNLAWLLALREAKGTEALDLVNRAITIAGPAPALLDTRAVVFLSMGQSNQAISDLKEAIAHVPTPARHFHLARAYHLAQDRGAAVKELEKARKTKLQASSLHPLERPAYDKLLAELERG